MTRWDLERAVARSNLPVAPRVLMFVLLMHTDRGGVEIPERHSPSLTTLAAESGLDRSTVTRQLAVLEDLGWVKRSRPAVRGSRERTGYVLAAGQNAAEKPKKRRRVGAQNAETNQGQEPAAESPDDASRCTQHLEVGAPDTYSDDASRCTEHLGVGAPGTHSERASRCTVHPYQKELVPDLSPSVTRAKPRPKAATNRPNNAAAVVAAYFDGAKAAGMPTPAGHLPKKIGRDAKTLLAEKVPIADLIAAATECGRLGWSDLATQLQRNAAGRQAQGTARRAPYRDGDREDLSRYDALTRGRTA